MTTAVATDVVTAYAEDVLAGRHVTGRAVRLACERHQRDLVTGPARGVTFNADVAEKAVSFFEALTHTKGRQFLGHAFHLEPWQAFIIGSLFGWQRADGMRRFRSAYVEVARKNGKALALDTPIPTPHGWATMADLGVGELVYRPDGHTTPVLAATEILHGRSCFAIQFSDGEVITADAEHEWPVHDRLRRVTRLVTTRELAETWRTGHRSTHREHRYRLPLCRPLDAPDRILPIPPYVLGAWLGDGTSACAQLTTADAEVVEAIAACGERIRQRGRTISYTVGYAEYRNRDKHLTLQARLRRLGLLERKHIPPTYLRASPAQRLELLRGLMDTDGSVNLTGLRGIPQCEFSTTSPALRDGVIELVRSLGLKPRTLTRIARVNGKDCGEVYRVLFASWADQPVFRLSRKRERLWPKPETVTRSMGRQVVNVQPVSSVPVRCIQVDGGQYLAGWSMIPTHNSTLAAGLALLATFFDGESGAEGYVAATKRDQARIVWDECKRMVIRTPGLRKRIKAQAATLYSESSASKLQPLGADADTLDGLNVHLAIVDELHKHKSRAVVDVIETATGARLQPLVFSITTAGFDRTSVCWELRHDGMQVLEGLYEDDTLFAYIAALDEGDDWKDEAVWAKANPNLGVSVQLDDLQRKAEKAKRLPTAQNAFRRLHLDEWTQQSERWLPLEEWDACSAPPAIEDGQVGYLGLDLSSTRDLSAAVLLVPQEDGVLDVQPYFWIPADSLEASAVERTERDKTQLRAWVRQGLVTATPGNVIDYDVIRRDLNALADRYLMREIAFDPWNATQIVTQLQGDGFECFPLRQGFASLTAPSKDLEARVMSRRLRHGGHPVLRWMAANAAVDMDASGNIKPSKKVSTEKIDGIVALVTGLDRVLRAQGEHTYLTVL